MDIYKFMFIFLGSLTSFTCTMEQQSTTEMTVVYVEEVVNTQQQEQPQPCCNSSTKLRVALVGLASTTITAIVALIIHFTNCQK